MKNALDVGLYSMSIMKMRIGKIRHLLDL